MQQATLDVMHQQKHVVERKLAEVAADLRVRSIAPPSKEYDIREDEFRLDVAVDAGIETLFTLAAQVDAERANANKKEVVMPSYAIVTYPVEDGGGIVLEAHSRLADTTTFADLIADACNYFGLPNVDLELYCDELGVVWKDDLFAEQELIHILNPARACRLRPIPAVIIKARAAKMQMEDTLHQELVLAEKRARVNQQVRALEDQWKQTRVHKVVPRVHRHTMLRESVFHIMFNIFFLLLLSLRHKTFSDYLLVSSLERSLTHFTMGGVRRGLDYIDSAEKIWDYLQGPFTDALFPYTWCASRLQRLPFGNSPSHGVPFPAFPSRPFLPL